VCPLRGASRSGLRVTSPPVTSFAFETSRRGRGLSPPSGPCGPRDVPGQRHGRDRAAHSGTRGGNPIRVRLEDPEWRRRRGRLLRRAIGKTPRRREGCRSGPCDRRLSLGAHLPRGWLAVKPDGPHLFCQVEQVTRGKKKRISRPVVRAKLPFIGKTWQTAGAENRSAPAVRCNGWLGTNSHGVPLFLPPPAAKIFHPCRNVTLRCILQCQVICGGMQDAAAIRTHGRASVSRDEPGP